jgi:hypothetical protein
MSNTNTCNYFNIFSRDIVVPSINDNVHLPRAWFYYQKIEFLHNSTSVFVSKVSKSSCKKNYVAPTRLLLFLFEKYNVAEITRSCINNSLCDKFALSNICERRYVKVFLSLNVQKKLGCLIKCKKSMPR